MWWKRGVDVGGCAVCFGIFWHVLASVLLTAVPVHIISSLPWEAASTYEPCVALSVAWIEWGDPQSVTLARRRAQGSTGNGSDQYRGATQLLQLRRVGASLRRPVTAHFFLFQPSIYFAAKHFLHTSQCVTQLTILTQHLVISKITFQSPLGPIFLVKARKFTLSASCLRVCFHSLCGTVTQHYTHTQPVLQVP